MGTTASGVHFVLSKDAAVDVCSTSMKMHINVVGELGKDDQCSGSSARKGDVESGNPQSISEVRSDTSSSPPALESWKVGRFGAPIRAFNPSGTLYAGTTSRSREFENQEESRSRGLRKATTASGGNGPARAVRRSGATARAGVRTP